MAGVLARKPLILRLVGGQTPNHIGQTRQLAHDVRHLPLAQRAALDAHMRGEHIERYKRAYECLCGRNADFQAGAYLQRAIGDARGLRAFVVAERKLRHAATLSFVHCGERVRGFAGLRYGHNKRAVVHNRIPIAKLGRIVRLRGDARQRFHPHAPQHAGVQACPHADDDCPVKAAHIRV